MSHIMCHVLFFFKFIFKTITATTVIAATVAMLDRTVVASLIVGGVPLFKEPAHGQVVHGARRAA